MVAALALSACNSEPPVTQGYIRDKIFEPAHWEGGYEYYTDIEFGCDTESEYNYATGQYETVESCGWEPVEKSRYEPHHTWVDDRYKFQLEACEKNDKGENKCRKGNKTVTESEYDRYQVGQHYPNPA
jgi:hypothetical protein